MNFKVMLILSSPNVILLGGGVDFWYPFFFLSFFSSLSFSTSARLGSQCNQVLLRWIASLCSLNPSMSRFARVMFFNLRRI